MSSSPSTVPAGIDLVAVFEASPAALLLLDPTLRILNASDQYLAITGLRREDLQGRAVFEAFPESREKHPDDLLAALAHVLRSRAPQAAVIRRYAGPATLDDQASWDTLTRPVLDAGGHLACLVHCIRDGQPIPRAAATARAPDGAPAETDVELLAGLPHRSLFEALANRMVASVRRRDELLVVLWIRLDQLDGIQDSHGLEVRNQVFAMAAWRLAHSLRQSDAVGHVEGSCFAACLYGLRDRVNAQPPVNKLLDSLSQPYPWGERSFTLQPRIGVSYMPEDGSTLEDLLASARTRV